MLGNPAMVSNYLLANAIVVLYQLSYDPNPVTGPEGCQSGESAVKTCVGSTHPGFPLRGSSDRKEIVKRQLTTQARRL
jgi:hypothetical protein